SIPGAKGAAGTGVSLIKFGAIISAIAGIFDTAQAFAAAKRVLAAGDNRAGAIYIGAGFGLTVSTGVFVYAVFKPLILGPLGLAVMLALTAYAISKWAEGNESVALERWARRCCFGKADEKPAVFWGSPEYADIAFAELNAATLGVCAAINFESNRSINSAAPRIGGLVSLELEHKLKFQVVLPGYSDECSAFRLVLVVHRHGDGTFPDFFGGETVLVDEYQALPIEALTKAARFSGFSQPRLPDYRKNISVNRKRKSERSEDLAISWLEITGAAELMPTIGSHTIGAATLLVMYWPDTALPDAYIEICVKELNE
ncbi:hypothetical protein CVV67_24995, partial [Arthrobacter stackebrandtii]